MKLNGKLLTLALLSLLIGKGFGQGFLNLNFESALIIADNSQGNPFIFATNAIPHWVAYVNGQPQTDIVFNTIAIDESSVSIHTTNSPSLIPVQGKYSVFLQGGSAFAYGTNSAIGQTGQIPGTALSLIFWGLLSNTQVTFAGNSLAVSAIGISGNYTIYGADISPFAGQTGQLLFTTSQFGSATLDNIQFSTAAVPEPSTLALVGLGGLGLAFVRIRRASRLCSKE